MRRRRRSVLATVLVLTLVAGACDWYQPGFNATNDGFSPTESVIGVGNVSTLGASWVHTVAGPAAPTLSRSRAAAWSPATGHSLAALDAGSGVTDWTATPPDDAIVVDRSDPCDGQASATGIHRTGDHRRPGVRAPVQLRPRRFSRGVPRRPGHRRADRHVLPPRPGHGEFTGAILSQTVAPGGATYITGSTGIDLGPGSSPASIVFLSSGGVVFYSSLFRSIIGRPAIIHKRAFLASAGGLNAVSLTAGGALWTSGLSSNLGQTPSVDGSRVYVTDGATLRAFDQTTGARVWTAALPCHRQHRRPCHQRRPGLRPHGQRNWSRSTPQPGRWRGRRRSGPSAPPPRGSARPPSRTGSCTSARRTASCSPSTRPASTGCSGSPGGLHAAAQRRHRWRTRRVALRSRPTAACSSAPSHADGNEAVYKFSLPG